MLTLKSFTIDFVFEMGYSNTKKALYELEVQKGKSFKNVDELFDDLDS